MDLAHRAFSELFPEKEFKYNLRMNYSGKFKGYNGNVKQSGKNIIFSLSSKWKNIDEEIQVGILQSLLCRLFRANKNTMNIEMYNNFMKNVHISIPQSDKDQTLNESFERVNEKFFYSMMDIASLKWSNHSKRCFGTYDYGTDTISINPVLKDKPHLLDYVMYHEMLHKKFKFNTRGNRNFHHTREFKQAENQYPDKRILDEELKQITTRERKKKCINIFDWF